MRSPILAATVFFACAIQAGEVFDPFDLTPAMPRSEVERQIEGLDSLDRTSAITIDAKVFSSVFERQTVTMRFDREKSLARVSIRIEPSALSDGRAVLQLYRSARSDLIRRLGAPEWEDSAGGDGGTDVLLQIADGEIVRTMQWRFGDWFVRAGIPRRVDGRVAVEVAMTRKALPRADLFWGDEP